MAPGEVEDIGRALERLRSSADAFSDDPALRMYMNRLGEAYQRIHEFGTSIEQYAEFGTEEDAKAVAATWPAAKAAHEELSELESMIPEYVVGGALAGQDVPVEDMVGPIARLHRRYKDAAVDAASDVSVDAGREFGFNVEDAAGKVAANDEEYDETHFFDELQPSEEELNQVLEELSEEFSGEK